LAHLPIQRSKGEETCFWGKKRSTPRGGLLADRFFFQKRQVILEGGKRESVNCSSTKPFQEKKRLIGGMRKGNFLGNLSGGTLEGFSQGQIFKSPSIGELARRSKPPSVFFWPEKKTLLPSLSGEVLLFRGKGDYLIYLEKGEVSSFLEHSDASLKEKERRAVAKRCSLKYRTSAREMAHKERETTTLISNGVTGAPEGRKEPL